MFDDLRKQPVIAPGAAVITAEVVKEIPRALEGFKDDFGTIKLTGYDNLEMLKKILVELQELNENFALMMGKKNV